MWSGRSTELMFSIGNRKKAASSPERPLRAKMLSKDLLITRGVELADYYSQILERAPGAPLKQRFRENCKVLNVAYFSFSNSARNNEMLAAGAEWLLDNFHVIDEQVRDIRRDLPRGYYQSLPKLATTKWRGYPRVYQLVCEFISHTDAQIEIDSLSAFIESYQSRSVLLIGEIWAIPIMFRLGLVENLRRLAEAGLAVAEHRQAAEQLCHEVVDQSDLSPADMLTRFATKVNERLSVFELGAAHILRRLRARGGPATLCLQWADEKLRERGIDPTEVSRIEQQSQAADQISVGNSVTALKTISSLNWREWFESVSHVDRILAGDPASLYSRSDFITRDNCRHRVELLARRSRIPETQVAASVVECAKSRLASGVVLPYDAEDIRHSHVGFYLIDDALPLLESHLKVSAPIAERFERKVKGSGFFWYLSGIFLGCLFATCSHLLYSSQELFGPEGGVSSLGMLWMLAAVMAFLIPISEWSISVIQWIVPKFISPLPLPKLDFEKGIPDTARALVVVQTIVGDRRALEKLVEALEIRFIGNDDPNLSFGILADLGDATSEIHQGDVGIIARARELISELNARYAADRPEGAHRRFFVLFRKRQWNESQGKFIGWERKRGKIMEFNRLLGGDDNTSFNVIHADLAFLRSCRYVITLDNDTQLPPGSAQKLLGTIAHPLNVAVFDNEKNIVIRGYSVIQPRVGITLRSATASSFASIFSGQTGLDPYTNTVSDVYQDLFGEGSYIGKGVYDVHAFERALNGRFPENSLLSHDLIEGNFSRCGLASDIEVFDEFPMRYHAQARRQHRWMRGDWQLLPFVGADIPNEQKTRYPTPLRALGRFKLVDNFRRWLVPPALLLSLLLIWTGAPGSPAWWFLAFLFIVGFPVYSLLWQLFADVSFGYSFTAFLGGLAQNFSRNVKQILLQITLIPHQAYLSIHAAVTSIRRLYFTHKDLLEWETAWATENRLGSLEKDFWKAMWPGTVVAVGALAIVLGFGHAAHYRFALPIIALWLAAPKIAWWTSRASERISSELASSEKEYLIGVAHSTWKYFDTFLNSDYHFLIPDNLQIIPERVVAERTSPTNIGLSLLSTISAYDLGFISFGGMLDRLSPIVDSLKDLERFHGHFLNWYGIRDKRSLPPRYISTVDSGNLVGHLIATRELMRRYMYLPLLAPVHLEHVRRMLSKSEGPGPRFSTQSSMSTLSDVISFLDSVEVLLEDSRRSGVDAETERALQELQKLTTIIAWTKHLKVLRRWGEQGLLPKKVQNIERILESRSPSVSLLTKLTNRFLKIERELDPNSLPEEERPMYHACVEDLRAANYQLSLLHQTAQTLQETVDRLIDETDFSFLFDQQKKLFTIGYNIDNGQRDNSYYDLLASEARLASLVAIAQGDIPHSHWFLLNRTLTDTPGGKALVSWAGTMFEYLMPLLVMKNFPGTLLAGSYDAVVRAQRSYAIRRGVPWGISESAYSGVDFHKTYQYRAFGIPGLGLKRGLGDDLVISPYSSAMAVMIDPKNCISNLKRLENLGARGQYGFFEAVDFTTERLGADENFHIVRSFLAHHQGMSLVAINNLLNQDIIQERFHLNPAIQSCELLLQERFPSRIPLIHPHQADVLALQAGSGDAKIETTERYSTPHTRFPLTRILSNGKYSTFVDNAGVGASIFDRDVALTRFVEDSTSGTSGTFFYIRDEESKEFWSPTYQPAAVDVDEYETIFNPDKIEFRSRYSGISSLLEITVSPEENVEIRRLSLTNISNRPRKVVVTSYGEVALASVKSDLSHPAFSKMFVSSEYLPEYDAILFERRPRTEHDRRLFLAHLVCSTIVWAPTEFDTCRETFIGRGGSLRHPAALTGNAKLAGRMGTVLDPIFALRQYVELSTGESNTLSFVTAAASSREEALLLIRKYREGQHITRAFEMAWSHSHVEIRHQQFSVDAVLDFQHLANALLYNIDNLRAPSETIRRSGASQSALWRLGISGDEPIVLALVTDPDQSRFIQDLLLGHEYLRQRGLTFDLVILNEFVSGYLQNFQEEIQALMRASASRDSIDQRGGVFLRSTAHLAPEEIDLLYASARVVLAGNRGPLASQLVIDSAPLPVPSRLPRAAKKKESANKPAVPAEEGQFWNGIGGFVDEGKSYRMVIGPNQTPPAPWINVIANENFGFLASESGGGYTWAGNSRENRLSVWTNDAVQDRSSEIIYIKDLDSGALWCPTPRPIAPNSEVVATHSFGSTSYATENDSVRSLLTLSGDMTDPVKYFHLSLENQSTEEKKLVVTFYLEWVLGFARPETYRSIRVGWDSENEFLHASNPFNVDFGRQTVFIGSSHPIATFTASRREFLGRNCDISLPSALSPGAGVRVGRGRITRSSSVTLSKVTGAGFDSCGAICVKVNLAPKSKDQIQFYLARTETIEQAREQAPKFRSLKSREKSLASVKKFWTDTTSAVQVKTPDPTFDVLVNGWLIYQTLSCRIFARSGFYQSSGAMGFRDQLQDSMALLHVLPERTRAQILLHASRQFREGDVQHWWHPPIGRGVRTRITDNYVWLPYVVLEYIEVTGDRGILNESIPFLEGPQLEEHQTDLYFQPQVSQHSGTLLEHCLLAMERSLATGPRGIPLIGGGDWNDGMNDVGLGGKGESVWLGWFIADVLDRASRALLSEGDPRREKYQSHAANLVRAVEDGAWDGQWYQRASFDDGTPLGSSVRSECRIDSLAQSWAVISKKGNPERAVKAMDSVYSHLVDDNLHLIRLLTPPFVSSNPSPGYIQSYPAGLRENGGQYTHGATWVVLAASELGDGDRAFSLYRYLNPITHSSAPADVQRYKTEPYALCGDVYTNADHPGRGGWSWYTGSSGWMFRIALENMIGIRIRGSVIELHPCIPKSWPEFSATLSVKGKRFSFTFKNPDGVCRGVRSVTVNGSVRSSNTVPLDAAEAENEVLVTLGA